ncbi:hypothetical protein TWF694_007676 [Orbilia ellipsospora]|uniref:GST N-terminal domain-containing protein n=1 Tax=Orbilia ellipsospora TaxID=2528407 RepID=A0AAV9XIG0_9PEZI
MHFFKITVGVARSPIFHRSIKVGRAGILISLYPTIGTRFDSRPVLSLFLQRRSRIGEAGCFYSTVSRNINTAIEPHIGIRKYIYFRKTTEEASRVRYYSFNSVKMSGESDQDQYLLIGVDQSMFTQKVRAYLRHHSIPFKDIPSVAKIFKTVVLPNTPYPLIPDLMIISPSKKYTVIQDSKVIMDYIQQKHNLPVTAGKKRFFAASFLEMIFDDYLFLHIINWRWGRPSQQKYLEYTFGDGSLPFEAARKIGARVLGIVGGNTASMGLTEKTAPVFHKQLITFLTMLTEHLDRYQFILGDELTKADYSLYGHLSAGLLRDPAPYEWLVSEFPVVHGYTQRVAGGSVRWGSRDVVEVEVDVEKMVLVSSRSTMGMRRSGGEDEGLEKQDKVPEISTRIARFLARDYVGILGKSVEATLEFLDGKTGEVVVPRGLKGVNMEFTVHGEEDGDGVTESRTVTTHCVYMLQRILDNGYRGEDRGEVDSWLKEVGVLEEWKKVVGTWEGSGWRMDLTREGTVATRKVDSARL